MAEGQTSDGWDPRQYERFARERAQPFHDLLALVQPVRGGSVIDLGCGTGELTVLLHEHVEAASTVGVDNSEAMLSEAGRHARDGLRFELGDIASVHAAGQYDVVFANAALQWVPDHEVLLRTLRTALRPGGQLAVQVPANADHPSHTVSAEIAHEPPFHEAMGGAPPPDVVRGVLPPERYAEILDSVGFFDQHVRLQVYGHRLDSTAQVVEWTKGTSLVRFRRVLPPELFERFVDRYRQRLLDVLGDRSPYFYAVKRILFWARLG